MMSQMKSKQKRNIRTKLVDQVYLEEKVEEWRREDPLASTFYRRKTDEESDDDEEIEEDESDKSEEDNDEDIGELDLLKNCVTEGTKKERILKFQKTRT